MSGFDAFTNDYNIFLDNHLIHKFSFNTTIIKFAFFDTLSIVLLVIINEISKILISFVIIFIEKFLTKKFI